MGGGEGGGAVWNIVPTFTVISALVLNSPSPTPTYLTELNERFSVPTTKNLNYCKKRKKKKKCRDGKEKKIH